MSAAKTSGTPPKHQFGENRGLYIINKDFEPNFNAVFASAVVFHRQLVRLGYKIPLTLKALALMIE